jgi:predicted transcriptional regulator
VKKEVNRMGIEERLKELIKSRYGSIREFTKAIDMPYSTVASIFIRGIDNASVTNVIRICSALGISADALVSNGRIIPVRTVPEDAKELRELLRDVRTKVLTYDDLTVGGRPADHLDRLAVVTALDIAVEVGLRHKELRGESE